MHRGYWHYPWYFGTKVPYNYIPIVILHISTKRILGSGSCKTSCTKLKKVKFFTRATPLRSKIPNIVQRDMQIRVALRSSFGPKLIWAATGAPPRPKSEILLSHTVCPKFKSPPCPRKADGPDSEFSQDHRTCLGSAWSTLVHAPELREVCRCIAVIGITPSILILITI